MEEKNFQLERLVFFSDAVIAIAMTLLALDIKIESTESGHLHYADIWTQWRVFAAFGMSFLNIANFWIRHHTFFVHSHCKTVGLRPSKVAKACISRFFIKSSRSEASTLKRCSSLSRCRLRGVILRA